jgi:origin recognition complex subunit 1
MLFTGKTATVLAAMTTIQHEIESLNNIATQQKQLQDIIEYEFIQINCLHMTKPVDAYSVLWKALSGGEQLSHKTALSRLKDFFSDSNNGNNSSANGENAKRCTVVCLLDELDYLVTQGEQVVYNFFNWPHMSGSNLIVIGIANTMDLPERLSTRALSRLGLNLLNRIVFKAYTHEQMYTILLDRIKDLGIFELKALELSARKAASSAGDLRAALKICQRYMYEYIV